MNGQQHSFSTQERVLLGKCQSFWDRKCLDLRGQGWGQIRFIKYKYKYKYIFSGVSNTNTNTNTPAKIWSNTNTNTNTAHQIQIQIQIHNEAETKLPPFSLYWKKIVLFIQISLKIVSKGPIYNKPALVQIMTWCWVGNKPLSDQWWPGLLMHKCITRPKWVNVKCSVVDCYLNVV